MLLASEVFCFSSDWNRCRRAGESPFRHGFASQRKALGRGRLSVRRGVDGQRTLSRNHRRERVTVRGWKSRFDTASPVNTRLWGGGGCPLRQAQCRRAAGCGWSTDFVTESRIGTGDGARVEVRFGEKMLSVRQGVVNGWGADKRTTVCGWKSRPRMKTANTRIASAIHLSVWFSILMIASRISVNFSGLRVLQWKRSVLHWQ
jgi:hypothetical protein